MKQGQVRVIVFGAHPDDCEYVAAGTAALWASKGHAVKFVSCTNGDIGHTQAAGGPLAARRTREVQRCAKILGIATEVLDNHDGELQPTLENRKKICTLIRQWNADLVIGHRPNDYHPDHRYTGVLVQDAAYMVTVPFFCPDIPHLTKNPVFLYSEDRFQKPNPFSPDIAVAIDRAIEKKLDCFGVLESQFYEGGCNATATTVPRTPRLQAQRRRMLREDFRSQFGAKAQKYRRALEMRYGNAAARVGYAEAFEICEYGAQPDEGQIRRLFPFFPGK